MFCFCFFKSASMQLTSHKMLWTRITRLNLYRKRNVKNHWWFSAGARDTGSPGIRCARKTLHHRSPPSSPGAPHLTILISSTSAVRFCRETGMLNAAGRSVNWRPDSPASFSNHFNPAPSRKLEARAIQRLLLSFACHKYAPVCIWKAEGGRKLAGHLSCSVPC